MGLRAVTESILEKLTKVSEITTEIIGTTIRLTWTAPTISGKIITGYGIMRETNGELIILSENTRNINTEYIDESIIGNTNYKYSIYVIATAKSDLTSSEITTPELASLTVMNNLVLWLDANDSEKIDIDSNNKVSNWYDKSAHNHIAVADGQLPTLKPNAYNGKSAITFESERLVVDNSSALQVSQNMTLILVYFATDLTAINQNIIHKSYAGEFTQRADSGSTTIFMWKDGGALAVHKYANTFLQDILSMTTFVRNLTNTPKSKFYLNSIEKDGTYINPTINPSISTYSINIGSGYTGTGFKGDLCEILLYDTNLSDTDRESVENYLKIKWGI